MAAHSHPRAFSASRVVRTDPPIEPRSTGAAREPRAPVWIVLCTHHHLEVYLLPPSWPGWLRGASAPRTGAPEARRRKRCLPPPHTWVPRPPASAVRAVYKGRDLLIHSLLSLLSLQEGRSTGSPTSIKSRTGASSRRKDPHARRPRPRPRRRPRRRRQPSGGKCSGALVRALRPLLRGSGLTTGPARPDRRRSRRRLPRALPLRGRIRPFWHGVGPAPKGRGKGRIPTLWIGALRRVAPWGIGSLLGFPPSPTLPGS